MLPSEPDNEIVSIDPATGDVVWQGPAGDVNTAVTGARAAFPGWAAMALEDRLAVIQRYKTCVLADAEAFARLIAQETGKPLWETRTEVASVAAKVDISITAYHERTGLRETAAGGGIQALRHKPHGVLAVLGPYNFPAHLPNGHIVPALIAGNTIVFKPSELTPAVALKMAEYWAQAGLPEGVLTVVPGAGETGKQLSQHDGIDGLLFTGSGATGAALHRQLGGAPHKILALEMGGNNPLVVWDVADMAAVATLIVQSAYVSAGQRCTCARRLILPAGPAGDRILEALTALIDRLIIGLPFDNPQPFYGPVVSQAAADHLLAVAASLEARGAGVLRKLTSHTPGKPLLTPGLYDVTALTDRADSEYFGPLLQVIRVADFDAALGQANATHFGLAAGLISDNEALYRRFWAASRAGIVNWNRPTTGAASNAPFGGVGASGNHRPSAYYAADYCAYPVAGIEAAAVQPIGFAEGVKS